MLDYIKKYQVFIGVFLFLISKHLLKYHLGVNEVDLLPVAKHFFNPEWISGDWYLDSNLSFNYRYLFNVVVGFFTQYVSLGTISIVGRLITLIVFSYFIQQISNYFNISIWFIIPFLFLYSNNHSIGAREWIINGFESKAVAYSFVLVAILAWLKKNYKLFFLYLGFAASFHVLVGAYAALTMIIALGLNWNYFRSDVGKIIKSSWIGVLSGSFGLYAIGQFLFATDLNLQPNPDLIYTLIRVPHHVVPTSWRITEAIAFGGIGLVLIGAIFITSKNKQIKLISAIPLASYFFMIIGLLVFFSGNMKALKFYWFRFPDAIVPLFAFVIFIPALIQKGNTYLKGIWPKVSNSIFIIGSLVLYYIFFFTIFSERVKEQLALKPASVARLDDELVEMYQWININTDKKSQFLIDPSISEFYLIAERPVLATVKHFPQTSAHVHEWYLRLSDIYGHSLPIDAIATYKKDLKENYDAIPESRLKYLSQKYEVEYFLSNKKREDLSLPLIINKGNYSLYRLD